jgi:uncharacterized protein (PEP-CTERM system associated)
MIRRGRRRGASTGTLIAVLLACSGAAGKAFAQDQAGSAGGTAPEAGSTGASGQTGAGAGAAAASATGTATENAAETTVAPAPGLAATAAPPAGVAVRLGDLGSILAAASSLGTAQLERPPGLTVTPSVGLQEEFTTNVLGTTGGNGDDFITSLTPGLLVNLATPKATGTLSYAPTFSLYANHSSDNNIAENLNGALDATILPQTLLFSLRAYASEQSTAGGVAPGGTTTLSTNNQTTNFGFSASPTFQHRFGDTGTLSLGYSLDYTNQNGNAAFAANASQPYFLSSRTLTNQETGSFTTGPDLGRFNDTLAANGAQSSGTGVLAGAYQYLFTNTLRYAVLRRVYAFGTFGYEDIYYPSLPPVTVQDGVWAAGLQLTPPGPSSITVGYGHFFGFNAPFARATIGLSPRTQLAISYADVLASSQQLLQSALGATSVNAVGTPIDNQSNFPVVLTNQLLSVQSGVMRSAQFSASLITTWPRDTLSLSVLGDQEKLVANAPGASGFSQDSWSGSVGWTHSLTPTLTATSYVQMGSTTSLAVGSGTTPVFAGQVSLLDQLTPTLFASLQYQIMNQSLYGGSNTLENSVIIALQKTF